MTHGLRILPPADADVDAATEFIARNSIDAALRFVDAVERTLNDLKHHPQRYPVYDLPDPRLADIRKCSVDGFPNQLILYRIDADMIEDVRILHGARDIPAVLAEEFEPPPNPRRHFD